MVDNGVSSAGLITTALPLIRAGAVFRAGMAMGKFHGVMSPTTPSGSRRVVMVVSGRPLGRTSPVAAQPSEPKKRSTSEARLTSPLLPRASFLPHGPVLGDCVLAFVEQVSGRDEDGAPGW